MFGGERVRELRVEGVNAGYGDVGVVVPDGAADGVDELGGVLRAADEEVSGVGRVVPVGKIDHVDRVGSKVVVAGVGDNSYYSEEVSVAFELAPEWALVEPDGFGSGFRDDCVFLSAIVLVKGSAFEHVLLNGGEVVGANPSIIGEGAVLRMVGGVDAVDPAFAGEEHVADEGDGLDSGQSAEFLENAVVEAGAGFVFGEGFALQVDIGGDDVVGGEAGVEGGEMDEALGEESGYEEEGGAGEDLCSYEDAAEEVAATGAGRA